ncbi:DNA translocase FtsK [Clostridium sp. MSJ-8]|uniref:FtsK/SpoIIIE family DNA translocase n=1 Tax=Clostridium sp. MSJ-8 TaxID=2841510 RepID=UPI001C0F236F|nr:DNA translocase FtsK [Clostridium sp. MSJ-8]MBU5488694.1 DNA translocase FtsK [Clostridium sp. MSJ-8]
MSKGNTKNKKTKKIESKEYYEIKGVIFIAVGILCALGIYTDVAGFLSNVLQKIGHLLLGIGAYFMPLYVIYLGIKYMQGRGYIKLEKKMYGITMYLIIIVLICGTIFISNSKLPNNFSYNLKDIYNLAFRDQFSINGGVIAYIITFLLYKLIGSIGSYILYGAVVIIASLITFDFSIAELFKEKELSKPKKKIDKKIKKDNRDDDFINIIDKDDPEKEEYLDSVNKKIKILDFMKNDPIHSEDEKTLEDQIQIDDYVDKKIEKTVRDVENANKKAKKDNIDDKLKENVSEEIDSSLNNQTNDAEKKYIYPDLNLLVSNNNNKLNNSDKKELIDSASKLTEILSNFGVDARVIHVTKGPSVTRYELQPSPGVKVSKIVNLADDIALGLAASGVRIEAPIPGKAAIGIEVPNKTQTAVYLREVIESDEFINAKQKLAFALGKDIGGECVVGDLSKMPHTLIAGATGSGKSVCINSLIISILYKYSPQEVKLLMVDPKVVELNVYNGIPHLLIPVVTDPKKAAAALNWAVNEMTRRYNLFAEKGVRNMDSYNALYEKGEIEEKLPYIIIIVDELADLMMVCPNDVEDYIGRLAQMARAAGMHLVIATQRPSVDVITGVIKANIPSRISFAVSSQIDSRTILDSAGAEKLLGKGDMLYYPVGESKPLRVQGCFISEDEVENVVEFIKNSSEESEYEESIIEHINNEAEGKSLGSEGEEVDELLSKAIEIVVESRQASTSFIQRKLRIGFNRAARIMDQLEERGIISERDGSKPRNVLVSKEDLTKDEEAE